MAVFPCVPRWVLPVWRTVVFGVAISAAFAGFTAPSAAVVFRPGGFGGGFHGGGSPAPIRPPQRTYVPQKHAPTYGSPKSPSTHVAPKSPSTHVPPKSPATHVPPKSPSAHVPQKSVSTHVPQKSVSTVPQTHTHSASANTPQNSHSGQYPPNRRASARHADSASKYKPTHSAHSAAKDAKKYSHSRSSYHAGRRHAGLYHPESYYRHEWHHHHWHHWHYPWWAYADDYGDYDDYWSYYDYAEYQRQAIISGIRAQIAAAEEVLESAVSRQEVAEKELQAAHERMVKAREAIDSAVAEQVESNKTMREIEDRVIAAQGSGSVVVQAQARVDAMRAALDQEVHRVLALPPYAGTPTGADYAHELAMLSPAQKEELGRDDQFIEATRKLKTAVQEATRARQALFEKDPEWVAARDKAVKAKQDQAKADRELGKVTGVGQLSPKVQLHGAQGLAEQARAVIAAGRAALRRPRRSLAHSFPRRTRNAPQLAPPVDRKLTES